MRLSERKLYEYAGTLQRVTTGKTDVSALPPELRGEGIYTLRHSVEGTPEYGKGPTVYVHDDLNMAKVADLLALPHAFFSICRIQREDGTTGFANPTPTQLLVLVAIHFAAWSWVNKYRQAKISTEVLMTMLRDCMYLEGLKGMVLADTAKTAQQLFQRLLYAYQQLPDDIRMPLATGLSQHGSRKALHFVHGGSIVIETMEAGSPAVGTSLDWLHISEFGEVKTSQQAKAMRDVLPAIRKRDHGRVVNESTPGRAKSVAEIGWRNALEGKGRYYAVFLKWWRDNTCREAVPPGFTPTPAEQRLMDAEPELTLENICFRRLAIADIFGGDPRKFDSKYPSGPYKGWLGSTNPVIPHDVLEEMAVGALAEHDLPMPRELFYQTADDLTDRITLIAADPGGFGDEGDPSGMFVMDAQEWAEGGYWEGREDPERFAKRLFKTGCYLAGMTEALVAEVLGGAPLPAEYRRRMPLIAVESNASACIAALKSLNYPNLHYTSSSHPGWYATGKSIGRAEAALVRALREGDGRLLSKATIHQLLDFDGNFRKRRVKGADEEYHHFDLARAVVIGFDVVGSVGRRVLPAPAEVDSTQIPEPTTDTVSLKRIEALFKDHPTAGNSVYDYNPAKR